MRVNIKKIIYMENLQKNMLIASRGIKFVMKENMSTIPLTYKVTTLLCY